jgi:hypothetical protein
LLHRIQAATDCSVLISNGVNKAFSNGSNKTDNALLNGLNTWINKDYRAANGNWWAFVPDVRLYLQDDVLEMVGGRGASGIVIPYIRKCIIMLTISQAKGAHLPDGLDSLFEYPK